MKKILISSALLSSVLSFAGGFRISLEGVRQLAMGHTSAHAEDASVAFFNPAGISFIPARFSVAGGGFAAWTKVTFQNLNTLRSYDTSNPVGTPFYAAAAYKITKNVSIGGSVTTPFGSTIEYPSDFSEKEVVQRLQLRAIYLQPIISVKLAPWVSLGGSYIHALGLVDWDKAATNLGGNVNLYDNKASGNGFSFGFYFQPDEKWDISVSYRSPVDIKAKHGVATFSINPSLYSLVGLDAAGKDNFTANLPLAEEYKIGATYKVNSKWLVSADYNYHGWERYTTLVLDFANAKVGNSPTDPTLSINPKDFRNTSSYRVGTQYAFNDMFCGRLGYYYDESPYKADNFQAEVPSFDTSAVTAGFGLKFAHGFGLDVAAALNFPKARAATNVADGINGQAKASAFFLGLGLSYNAF